MSLRVMGERLEAGWSVDSSVRGAKSGVVNFISKTAGLGHFSISHSSRAWAELK
jgi:hypothetical protein